MHNFKFHTRLVEFGKYLHLESMFFDNFSKLFGKLWKLPTFPMWLAQLCNCYENIVFASLWTLFWTNARISSIFKIDPESEQISLSFCVQFFIFTATKPSDWVTLIIIVREFGVFYSDKFDILSDQLNNLCGAFQKTFSLVRFQMEWALVIDPHFVILFVFTTIEKEREREYATFGCMIECIRIKETR